MAFATLASFAHAQTPTGLDAVIDPAAKVEKIAGNLTRAGGATFSRGGYLLFSDAGSDRILKYEPGQSEPTVWREKSNGSTGIASDRQGRVIAAETAANRITRTDLAGSVSVVADKLDGKAINQPNGVLAAIDGSTYFTVADKSAPSVGQIMRDGKVRVVAKDLKSPGGLALTADQRTLFVSDAATGEIRAYGIRGDGRLVDSRIFATAPKKAGAALGGMVADVNGNLYCAGAGGILVFDAQGRHLGTIAVPETPAAVTWGDGYRSLYIPAQTSLYRVAMKATGTQIH